MRRWLIFQVALFALLGAYFASAAATARQKPSRCTLENYQCPENQTCVETRSAWECKCSEGYTRKWVVNDTRLHCEDVDECNRQRACRGNSHCINSPGSYDCVCNDGYRGDGVTCEDIDECAEGVDDCSPHAKCKNREGDHKCRCKWGYEGNGTHCDVPHCVGGWRQTSDCMIAGDREPWNDLPCNATVPNGVSGWCECELERQVKMKCYHFPFTCDEACEDIMPEGDPPLECQRFYRTANCDPEGSLILDKTMGCDDEVRGGVSGFCMCEDGRKAGEVGCVHPTFTCEKECEKLTKNATLATEWDPDAQDWVEEEDFYLEITGKTTEELDYDALVRSVRVHQAQVEHDLQEFLDAHKQVHVLQKRQQDVAADLWDLNESLLPNETFAMLLHNFKRVEDEMNVLGMLLIHEGAWGGHEGLYLEEVSDWVSELSQEMGSISNEVYSLSKRIRSTELLTYSFQHTRVPMLNRFLDSDKQKLLHGGKYMLQSETRLGRCLTRSVVDLDPEFLSGDSHFLGFIGCYHQTNASVEETKMAVTTPERIMDETANRQWEILPTRNEWDHASWIIRADKPTYLDEDEIEPLPTRWNKPSLEKQRERFGGEATRRWREKAREHQEYQWRMRRQCIIKFYGSRVALYPCDWGKVKEPDEVHNDQGRWFINTLTGGGGVWQIQRTPFKKKRKFDPTFDDRCLSAEASANELFKCDEVDRTTFFATPIHDEFLWMGRYWAPWKDIPEPSAEETTEETEEEGAEVIMDDDLPIDMDDDERSTGEEDEDGGSLDDGSLPDRLIDIYFVCNDQAFGEAWWSAVDDSLFLCDGEKWVPASEENLQLTDEVEGVVSGILRPDLQESFYESLQMKEAPKWFRKFTKWEHCRWRPEDHYIEAIGGADDDEAHAMTLEERIADVRRRVRKTEHDFNELLDGFARMRELADRVNELKQSIEDRIDGLAALQYKVQRALRKLAIAQSDLTLAHAVRTRPKGARSSLPRKDYWDKDISPADTDTFVVAQTEELRKMNLELYVLVMKFEAEKQNRYESLAVRNKSTLAQECAGSSDNGLFVIRVVSPDGDCIKSAYSLTEGPGKGVEVGKCEWDENGEFMPNSVWFLQHSLNSKWIVHPSDDWSRCMIMFTRSYQPGLFPCAWGWRKHKDVENEQGRWMIHYKPEYDGWTIMNRWQEKCLLPSLDDVTSCKNESAAAFHLVPVTRSRLRIGIAPPPPKIDADMYRVRNLTHLAIAASDEITRNETTEPKGSFGWSGLDEVDEEAWIAPDEEEVDQLTEEEKERERVLGTQLSVPYTYDDEEYKEEEPINDAFAEGELWAVIRCNERNAGQVWWSRLDSWLFTCDGEFWVPAPGYIVG